MIARPEDGGKATLAKAAWSRLWGEAAYYVTGCRRVASRHISRLVYGVLRRCGKTALAGPRPAGDPAVVWEGRSADVQYLALPKSNRELPESVTERAGAHRTPAEHVMLVRDVRLIGPGAVPFDRANTILDFAVNSENYSNRFVHLPAAALFAGCFHRPGDVSRRVDCACSMVNAWSSSYYHWLVEFLPRLLTLDDFAGGAGVRPSIVIRRQAPGWQLRSMQILGIEPERLVTAGGTIQVNELYVPSFPRRMVHGRQFSLVNAVRLNQLRDALTGAAAPRPGEASPRLVVSRANAVGRRIVNEDELLCALRKHGYRTVVPDELSLDAQIRMFAGAEAVLGPHGAGLTNLLFCRPGTRVLEVSGGCDNTSFYTLAETLGHRYALFRCARRRSLHPKRADLTVEVPELLAFLNDCGML